jgi:hypothetical protein
VLIPPLDDDNKAISSCEIPSHMPMLIKKMTIPTLPTLLKLPDPPGTMLLESGQTMQLVVLSSFKICTWTSNAIKAIEQLKLWYQCMDHPSP